MTVNKAQILLLADVIRIAKYLSWQNGIGNEKAQAIISEIHSGKYEDTQGIWVQVNEAMESLCEEFSIPKTPEILGDTWLS